MGTTRILFTLVLFVAVRSVEAQTPPEKPVAVLEARLMPRSDEHLLLARLLEYLHRDTFPPMEKVDADDEKLPSSGQLKTFIEGRKRMVSNIKVRLRDAKASDELVAMYDEYATLLTLADKYADAVRDHELTYFKGIQRLREQAMTSVQVRNLLGAANLIRQNAYVYADSVGWYSGWDPWRTRRGLFAGATLAGANLVAANLRAHADILVILERYKQRVYDYEKKNLPILNAALRSETAKFQTQIDEKRPAVLTAGGKHLAAMTGEFQWKEYEVTLDPFTDAPKAVTANPFDPLSRLNRARVITTTREADDLATSARMLLLVAESMPVNGPKEPTLVYNRIRADVAFLAGMHANRAAEFMLGDAGFAVCEKLPLTPGETARKAFAFYDKQYVGSDAMYPQTTLYLQKSLAAAYAGIPQLAYDTLNNNVLAKNLKEVHDAQFYYDAARLRCLNKSDNRNIPVAMQYLSTAFLMGYRNTEKARVSADFKDLRKVQQANFEKAIEVFK